MSCELRVIATLDDHEKCRQSLFEDDTGDNSWLQKCIVAVSPSADLLVIAHGPTLLVLTLQWDKSSNSKSCPRFVVSRRWGAADCMMLKIQNYIHWDDITAISCLPLVPVGSHSQSGVDWTCIAVGFSTGYLRFFTENMDLVAAERLHSEPLLQIKATSHRKRGEARPDGCESAEAVYAVYPSVVFFLPGFSLFQTLRGCRSQVALNLAGRKLNFLPDITLDAKKYSFSIQPVRDASVVGLSAVNNFDHLMAASLNEGFYSNYRPSPPQHTLVASTGSASWLQFQNTMEGVAAPLELTDVALTVISKLPGWLGLGTSKTSEPVVRPAEKLAKRGRLLDRRREGRRVVASPDASLLAVSDSLGRVTLVDVRTGVAVRMWKGYRDAECGFLEVEEEVEKTRHRHRHRPHAQATTPSASSPARVLLLAIFSPKKGVIELFSLRHGPRVAALRVSKNGRLIYTPHGLLGFSTIPRKGSTSGSASVAFLSEEGLMDIHVPFHCALMDANDRTKDLHELKQLKTWMKEAERDEASLLVEVASVVRRLLTDEGRLHAVDLLTSLSAVTPEVLSTALDVFLEVAQDTDVVNSSGGSRNLLIISKQLRNVVKFYKFIQEFNPAVESLESSSSPMAEVLHISDAEIAIVLEFVQHAFQVSGPKREARVTFHEAACQSLPRFLQSLDISECEPILQKPNLPEEDVRMLGEFIFSRLSHDTSELKCWRVEARLSNISHSVFAHCLVVYWLHRPVEDVELDMRRLVVLLKSVSSLSDEPVTSSDYNVESPWWTEIRSAIAGSRRALVALIVAICCRAVSLQCEQEVELTRCEKSKDNADEAGYGWENVSADTWQWDLLITHLEDVSILNTVLTVKPAGRRIAAHEPYEVSLKELVASGEGAVSELIAKWLCQFTIPPFLLVDKSDIEFQTTPIEPEHPRLRGQKKLKGDEDLALPLVEIAEEVQTESELESTILGHMRLLKRRFPYSLTCSAVLSHMGWELLTRWQHDLPNVSLLAAAVDHLKVIPSAHLKAGVCSLAWSTYLKVPFEGIARLIGKMGKLPTDTLCTQELGIPRGQIAPFLQSAVHLLSALLDASAERPQPAFPRMREAIWREGSPGLVAVAVSRATPCEDVVLLHHQIATVLHMVAALELRDRSLLSALLDSMKTELFGELIQRRQVALHHPGLSEALLLFLQRAVSAAVQTVREVEGEGELMRLDADAACHWLRVCCELASTWRLPLDTLRRQHVCELYSFGFDRLAEEALAAVSESSVLASQLLVVAGQRVKSFISTSSAPQDIIATLSPVLTCWLDSLNEEGLKDCRASIEDTETLMTRILQWLPEGHNDIHLATLLAESLPGLMN